MSNRESRCGKRESSLWAEVIKEGFMDKVGVLNLGQRSGIR